MVVNHTGRCGQNISQTGGMNKGNRVFNTESQNARSVHRRGDGQVGQSEERPALADSPAVEMFFLDRHSRAGARFINKSQLNAIGGGETVVLIQQFE